MTHASTVPIAVTGATGGVGGRVARLLQDAGLPQRLIVRDASRAPQIDGAELAVATYSDAAAARAALEGIDLLFMVSAAENADRLAEHRAFIEAARASGVGHVVYTSFFGASPESTFTLGRDHAATERMLRDTGMSFTFLRDNLYTDFLPMLAGEDGVIRGPAGDGRLSSVLRDDVAECAAAVLRDPGAHAGATYDLTGPTALGLTEVAAALTADGSRGPIEYVDETLDEAYASRAVYGAPRWQVDAWVSTYTAIASGELAGISPDVERLTGHPARSLDDFLAATR
ncbi:SDR family oxidoreductase [Herbiconiux daphne]|uniref:SDR family oxidoreductase n=1 Tax=Herbiconiux daphne TaxID=2970914 RepID=A0ABT2H7K2_9MICO|nr:SDR family oxidoreductase [Herbiconiux daphne]MCS5735921.1 SDR family oxidoreductase [Herbiconiux daphne]